MLDAYPASLPACLSTTGDKWRIDRIGSTPLLTEQLTSILPAFGCTNPEDCSHWWHCSEPLSSSYDIVPARDGYLPSVSLIDRSTDLFMKERNKERNKERFRWISSNGKTQSEYWTCHPIQSNPSEEWLPYLSCTSFLLKQAKTRQDKSSPLPFLVVAACLSLQLKRKKESSSLARMMQRYSLASKVADT